MEGWLRAGRQTMPQVRARRTVAAQSLGFASFVNFLQYFRNTYEKPGWAVHSKERI